MEVRSCEQIIHGYLDHKEVLKWSGRPAQGIKLRPKDALLIPFSLAWCGFAIFWEYTVMTTSPDHFFPLYGSFFVAVGLYFVFGRFIADAWIRSRTYYGITDHRVIIISGLFSCKIQSLLIRTMADVSMQQKDDGSGSILFGKEKEKDEIPWTHAFQFNKPTAPCFEFVQNVAVPFRIIREIQEENPSSLRT